MADRYQNRSLPSDDGYDRSVDQPASRRDESDPLAELARLIGQTDPFGKMGRANRQVAPRAVEREPYQPQVPLDDDDGPSAGPPPWMQRANRQEVRPRDQSQDYAEDDAQDYPNAVHPLHRYAAAHPAREPDYQEAPQHADEPDPSRYDDALYGEPDTGAQDSHEPPYADDVYAYQEGYGDDEERAPKRRGGLVTVAIVLALAVVGTGAAFAYRTFVGSPRSGEPPIIKADAGPTKIVPAPSDGTAKVPDRMASGDSAEKIVPREEAPIDVNAKSAPRVVFPPLNPNSNPPQVASAAPNLLPPGAATNGTLPNSEPRKIKTLTVRGDQPDGAASPVGTAQPPSAKPTPAGRATASAFPPNSPSVANASANAPLSLAPQGPQSAPLTVETRTRVASTNPAQTAPTASVGSGGYLVQVSSQRNEADAQSSYRALQGKFPAVLGSRSPVIRRADLADKGVYYRAMVGPFGTPEEASQFCGNLKSAGGQCVVQRN
jgi:hypothetical protein